MKKYINIILTLILLIISKTSFAVDWGILWNWSDLRNWEISFWDIPDIITNAISFLMLFAATISVIFIIIWAYKILFGSISQDKTKWRDTILMAIWGFIIASLAWFIIKLVLDNFS